MISKDTETKVVEMMNWLPGSYKAALNEFIQEGAKMEKELQLAQHTEQHLKSAEKALAEKDARIGILHESRRALAQEGKNKDAEIAALQATIASKERQLRRVRELLAEKEAELKRLNEEISRRGERNDFLDRELYRTNYALAEVTKRNKSLADEVLKWQAIVKQKNSDNSRMRTELDLALQRSGATDPLNMQMVASLREERDKYREALRDLVGTLSARADHDRELADAVKSVLNV